MLLLELGFHAKSTAHNITQYYTVHLTGFLTHSIIVKTFKFIHETINNNTNIKLLNATQQETVKAHHLVDVICSPGSVDIPMYGRHWFAAGQYV